MIDGAIDLSRTSYDAHLEDVAKGCSCHASVARVARLGDACLSVWYLHPATK